MSTGWPISGARTFCGMAEKEEKARAEFAERLIKAREYAGLSQPQLALAVKMSQSNLGGLEVTGNGSRKTAQIAQACGVRPEWLASGKGPMTAAPTPKLRPELQEIIRAFQGLKEHQVAFVMEAIRGVLEAAPRVPDPTDQPKEPQSDDSSSSFRRVS